MIGVDIVEIKRIQQAIDKGGQTFLKRTFTPAEIEYCEAYKYKYERYAARFAAKEAVAKVIQVGPSNYWLDIEISHNENGAPIVILSGRLREQFHKEIQLSISHERHYAVAVALVV